MGRSSVAPPRPGPPTVGPAQRGGLPGVPAYDGGPAWRRDSLSADGIGWIGAHGGAGATTLARLLGGSDIGCRWPDPALAEPAQVMVVGRTNLDGLRAVSRALNAMREGRHPVDMRLIGVVLIADVPGRLPQPLLARIRLLRSISPVYRIPWIPQFRVGAEPKQRPRQLSRLSSVIDRHVGSRRQS
ncbi:DUF6668 family protein [Micromonospora sp. LOL_024]|uniref:DUF6668 family protein n=1 Tax=Micromonospora sp. LOL_024 TaxID=3345412 RepID=UPI003A8950BE